MGRGREPWERSEAGGVIGNERHLHQCNTVDMYGKKEAGTGEHLNTFNNQINKHNRKAAAPRGRLPHTKHKLKLQAWSSLVFHCCHSSFNPSEAPPWDSRPVSGAGVVHYQLLHRPRSVPTALGPAPLATILLSDKTLILLIIVVIIIVIIIFHYQVNLKQISQNINIYGK